MGNKVEIDAYILHHPDAPVQNACTLCGKKPTTVTISLFCQMFLGSHITPHLCEEEFNDVGILKALKKAIGDEVVKIENSPTWKTILENMTFAASANPTQ